MKISDNLNRIRNEAGLSQTDVAKELGITRQGYNHYETGKRIPPLDILEKLCSIFGVDMNELTLDCLAEGVNKEPSTANEAAEALRIIIESKLGRPAKQEDLVFLDSIVDAFIKKLRAEES